VSVGSGKTPEAAVAPAATDAAVDAKPGAAVIGVVVCEEAAAAEDGSGSGAAGAEAIATITLDCPLWPTQVHRHP